MIKKSTVAIFALVFISDFVISARAQNRNIAREECHPPIYASKEVTRRAKIIEYPDTNVLTKVALQYDFHGTISAEAVLCRNGRVTDIHLITTLPLNLNEFVIAAIGTTRFTPAELNWHTVSQKTRFELSINGDSNLEEIDPTKAEGRLLERVEIMGNRTINHERILSWIKTRPGEPYNENQIKRDLEAILANGYFDKRTTRVHTEQGVRGGVGVTFEVVELPVINEIKFQGLTINQSIVVQHLKEQLNVQTGARYRFETMNDALAIIKQVLESKGQHVSKIDVQTKRVSATAIDVTFVVAND